MTKTTTCVEFLCFYCDLVIIISSFLWDYISIYLCIKQNHQWQHNVLLFVLWQNQRNNWYLKTYLIEEQKRTEQDATCEIYFCLAGHRVNITPPKNTLNLPPPGMTTP